jgi:hypothetical protein
LCLVLGICGLGHTVTFEFEDFGMVNFLVRSFAWTDYLSAYYDTGKISGYIDLEATTLSPLWECTTVTESDPSSHMRDWYGGTPEEQKLLWDTFHHTIDQYDPKGERRRAYECRTPVDREVG